MNKLFVVMFFVFSGIIQAQNVSDDCFNSVNVYTDSLFKSNVTGVGTVANEITGDRNSVWLKINVIQSGTLGFEITPKNQELNLPYNFGVYGPNNDCSYLGNPIRSCTTKWKEISPGTNRTGMNGNALTDHTTGNGYVRWLEVTKGDFYYIRIDKPARDADFDLQWTGSAVNIENATDSRNAFAFAPPPVGIIDLEATISSNATTICTGDAVTITITGTPNAIVRYTINGGEEQAEIFDASGTFSFSESPTTTTVYALTAIKIYDSIGVLLEEEDLNDAVTVTVKALPVATITSTETICSGETGVITFTGTANSTVTYTVDGGSEQEVILNALGTGTVSTTTAGTYTLVRVMSSGTPVCSQDLSGSATITIKSLPTATISGTTTICSGETAVITFTGTPNSTVIYTVDEGSEQEVVLNALGIGTASTTIAGVYTLVRITGSGTPVCSQNLSGSATITIKALPTATISGTTTICSGETAVITFTGTPNSTVIYTVDEGSEQEVVLNALGTGTVSTNTAGVYTLVRIAGSGTPVCSQNLSGSATITIKALPTATISGTTTICSGETAVITFTGTPNSTITYTYNEGSEQEVVLNAAGTGSVSVTATGIYALVSVTSSGTPACSQDLSGSATITVRSLPTATISGTTTICSGETAVITFTGTPNSTITYTYNEGSEQEVVLNASGTGTVSTTTAGVYTLVQITGSGTPVCSQNLSGSATITIKALPAATISGTKTICSGETAVITFTGTANSTVIYTVDEGSEQEVVLNASGTGTVSITTAGTYKLVRVVSSGTPGCSQDLSGSATITVKPLPTATISGATTICSGETAIISFTGTPLATVMYSINDQPNKYITLDAGGTATIISPEVTASVTYRLINIVAAGLPACSQPITGSLSISIIPVPEIPVLPPYKICSNDTNGNAVFDLTIKENEIKANNTALTVTFHALEIDANSGQNTLPMSYTSGSATIYVRVTNTITGCYSVAPMDLQTELLPVVIMPVTPVWSCNENDTNGIGSFNLNALIPGMVNGQTNISISFHETQENAQNGLSPITAQPYFNNTPWNQTIWVLATNTVTGCQKVYSFRLSVERKLILPTELNLDECDVDANPYDNRTTFDLTVNTAEILAAQTDSSIAYQVNYYSSISNAESDIPIVSDGNLIGTNGQTIWVRIKSKVTGCFTIGSFKLLIRRPLQLIHPDDIIQCGHTQSNDEQQLFDLTIRESQITGGATGYTFNYYTDVTLPPDATTLINTPTAFLNTDTPQTVLVEVISEKGCKSYETVTIIVEPLERPTPNAGFVCIDSNTGTTLSTHIINSGLDAATHTFQWYKDAINGELQPITGAIGMAYEVSQPGSYTVIATTASGCVSLPAKVLIEKSEPAKVRAYTSKAFSDKQSITVEAIGIGEYVYQLDDGSLQSDPVFTNVNSGLHWITVYDNNGCSDVTIPIRIINYPHYFTPNGDGYHDFWNIGDLVNDPNANISIFDRYGKLLKQMKPSRSSGWNGMLNGRPLPATDYWFTVTYTEDGVIKEFKSHFSLKR